MAMNMDAMLRIKADVQGENNIRRLGNSMQGLQGQVKNTSMAVAGLGAAFKGLGAALAVGGFATAIKGAIDLADDMRDLSQRTGVGIETLGQFKVAAELSGTSLEGVAKGLGFLNRNMVAAATGGNDAAAAFTTVGVSIRDASGQLRSADQVFLDVADQFAAMKGGAEKNTLAVKLFGRAGADLIPILNLGSKEIQRFGLGIGPDFANKADAFNDSLGIMKAQVTVLTVQIGSALLPVLSGLVTVVAQGVTFVGNLAAEFYKAIGGAAGLQQIAATLIKTMVVLGSVTAGVFIATNVTTFATALRGVLTVLRPMVILQRTLLAIETARASVLGVIAALQTPGPAQTKAIAAVAAGTLGTFALVAGVGKMIDDLTKRIGDTLGKGLQMPNIPTPAPGATPDLTGLRTGATPKKTVEMTERMFDLQLKLNSAEQEGNTIAAAYLKYQIAQVKYDETKLKTRDDALELVKAETALTKELGEAAAEVGRQVAADFMKRQELQDSYNQTVQDLQIKAGLITGDKLKQLEIDREVAQILERLPGLTDAQIAKIKELVAAAKEVKDSFDKAFKEGIQDYYKTLSDFGGQVASSLQGAFQGLEDQLTNFVMTGKANFTDLANSIIADIARIAIRQAVIRPLVGGLMDIFNIKPSAMGNVFAQNGIQKFARGGIVDRPTLFPFANGTGLMGEAGPEAIMPLRRGRDGRLGVQSAGGGAVNVTVNVDASGTQAQGNNPKANAFGKAISAAVQAEIIRQKRPGGALS